MKRKAGGEAAFEVAPHGEPGAAHLVSTRAGWVGILSREDVICRVVLPLASRDAAAAALREHGFSGRATPPPKALRTLVDALRAYLAGKPVDPATLPIIFDPGPLTPFAHAVYANLRQVGRGKTVTYGALAAASGKPRAGRAVGVLMGRNRFPLLVPCHRVVAAGGGLGGFSSFGGLDDKRRLLRLEGVGTNG